jgi:hypothetical protein
MNETISTFSLLAQEGRWSGSLGNTAVLVETPVANAASTLDAVSRNAKMIG